MSRLVQICDNGTNFDVSIGNNYDDLIVVASHLLGLHEDSVVFLWNDEVLTRTLPDMYDHGGDVSIVVSSSSMQDLFDDLDHTEAPTVDARFVYTHEHPNFKDTRSLCTRTMPRTRGLEPVFVVFPEGFFRCLCLSKRLL